MAETDYDLIVIGAGPGGYVAAIRAAQLGMTTAIVEREHLGGICLNWGCIPTKALLRTAELNHHLHNLDEFGLQAKEIGFDLEKVVKRSRKAADQLSRGVASLLKKNKIETIMGAAQLGDDGAVQVADENGETRSLTATNILIATGARPRELPGLEADGERIWTYKHAMIPETMPESLLVIGAGAIGIEFASFYRDMGAEVTVVELVDRILPAEDADISAFARKQFEGQGIAVHTETSVDETETGKSGVKATLKHKDGKRESLTVDRVILSVGIQGNVEGLGLEDAGVKIEKNQIVTDDFGETDAPGIWAIGDVAGPPWLAHKASHEGVVAVEKMAGAEGLHPLDYSRIPACTYSRPQVASVGLTQGQAEEAGHSVKTGNFPFIGNGKAIAMGEPEGFVKTVFDAATGELLGAHMIGAEVTELIQGYTIAKSLETTEAELMHTVFPHPTLSEMMHESVLDAYGRAIHY